MRRRWKAGENEGVFDGELLLVVVPVGDPRLHGGAVERPRNKTLMKGMLVVIALLADGVEPRNEAGAVRCDRVVRA
jgi:hypothetical protein